MTGGLRPDVASDLEWVFVDVDGTLVHEDVTILEAVCDEIVVSARRPATRSDVGRVWEDRFLALCDESHGARFRFIRDIVNDSLRGTIADFSARIDFDAWAQAVLEYAERPTPYYDARAFLSALDVPVCLVSNRDRAQLATAASWAELPFGKLVCSEDARAYKPHPRVFEVALEVTRAAPARVLHVGDSYKADVLGASALGIRTVWLNRDGRALEQDDRGVHSFVVASLLELLS